MSAINFLRLGGGVLWCEAAEPSERRHRKLSHPARGGACEARALCHPTGPRHLVVPSENISDYLGMPFQC
jgi:hypothetical protein